MNQTGNPMDALNQYLSTIIIIIVIVLIVFAIVWMIVKAVAIRNHLVALSVSVDSSFAQIATELQRRYDLIPNLVAAVKGYAAHESGTFEKVTEARNLLGKAMGSGDAEKVAQAEADWSQARLAINAVAENYPNLQASTNFLSLQEELTNSENKVAACRHSYNDVVKDYNIGVETFPANIIAGLSGFHKRSMFDVESDAAKHRPTVEF